MPIPYGTGYAPPLAAGVHPQPDNVPPRIGIGIADPGSVTATVYRADVNGEVTVRGTPITLDAQGCGTVWDYEASFDTDTTYTVVTS